VVTLRHWIRRYKRHLLVSVAAGLILAWLIIPPVLSMLQRGPADLGRIHGKAISAAQARYAQRVCRAMRILDPGLATLLFAGEQEISNKLVWRYLCLAHEAEAAGVGATQAEVEQRLQGIPALMTGKSFDPGKYYSLQLMFRLTDQDVRGALAQLIAISKLISFRAATVKVSKAELWSAYAFGRQKAKLRFISMEPQTLAPLVQATEQELRDFYEAHKDIIAEAASGQVGYKTPQRARVGCAVASYDVFAEEASVSEEEIGTYYEDHKDRFIVPEQEVEEQEPAAQGASEEEKAGEGAAAEEPGAPESGSEAAAPKQEETGQNESGVQAAESAEPEPQKRPRYKKLAEVREEIVAELKRQKAQKAASQALDAALDDLRADSQKYIKEPLPLEQMARRHKLRYMVLKNEEGREFLSRAELDEVPPHGNGISSFAFDEELYYPRKFDTAEGPCICQVLKRQEPYVEPYDDVRGRVAEDYRREKALEQAEKLADELVAKAVQSSLEEAVGAMNARLKSLLRTQDNEQEAGEGKKAEQGTSHDEETSQPQGILKIQQTEFFTRSESFVPAMGGMRPNVVKKAFELGKGQIARVTDGQKQQVCYVIEKLDGRDADPAEFYKQIGLLRSSYLLRKQFGAVKSWMDELVAASEPQFKEQ